MKDIAIVICNFNKKEYLRGCLDSLLLSDLDLKTCDIIVVDNASEDGAPQMIKNEYANEVILLENEINSGGAGGFARGINYAIDRKYNYLVLLDNDIKLEPNTISALKQHLDLHDDVAIVGSKICTMDSPDILQELGSFIDMEKFNATTPLKGHKDSDDLPDVVECDYVPACCLIAKMDVVRKIGAFDVNHFIYWDDMDWCTKARELGYKVHAINASKVFHKMGAINSVNTFSLYYFERNRILFFLKHLKEEDIPKFTDIVAQELINLTFFSNEKKRYNSAISQLLGISDLERGLLGRQDERILTKEQTNPFELFNDKKSYAIIFVPIDAMMFSRKIYQDLSNFFEKEVTIATDNIEFFKKEFSDEQVIDINHIKHTDNQLFFYAAEHIMSSPKENTLPKNSYFIDGFTNIQSAQNIHSFLDSYERYRSIFLNIFKPVLEDQFQFIYSKLYH
jgi:hypothetical protein